MTKMRWDRNTFRWVRDTFRTRSDGTETQPDGTETQPDGNRGRLPLELQTGTPCSPPTLVKNLQTETMVPRVRLSQFSLNMKHRSSLQREHLYITHTHTLYLASRRGTVFSTSSTSHRSHLWGPPESGSRGWSWWLRWTGSGTP